MRTRMVWRTMLIGTLLAGVLGACGDDDDVSSPDTTAPAESTTAADHNGKENTIEIEMVDYGYKVEGTLETGVATITSKNTGEEWHMAGLGKLKEGKTVEQLVEALKSSGGPEGGGEEDPTADFIDQENELGSPGHILQPGRTQSLTVDVLDAGTYVMLCFLPTEGEGTPHFAKGMVGSFDVEEKRSTASEPHEDITVALPDDAEPTGIPTEVKTGSHTFKVTSSGAKGKDFAIVQLNEGKAVEDFDRYFGAELFEKEGGPAKGAAKLAPGTILGSTFEIGPGQTIWMTVDLSAGDTYFVNTTNSDDEQGDEEGVDKFVKVTVT